MYNLVYINTHDTGRMIKPYGYAVDTDALQGFAQESTLFTQAYCCSPTCSPSRASMLTGIYPHQNGMLGLAQRGFGIDDKQMHLANYLKSAGYQTAISGIQHEVGWYLDLEADKVKELGYDVVLTCDSKKYHKEDLHVWDQENVEKAVSWLDEIDTSKPFMLAYGMHSTHRPYPLEINSKIDERYVALPQGVSNNPQNRHDQAQFLTSAINADDCVKTLIDALKQKGLYDNTIILFTTDHGLALPFHKCNLNDQGIGVSLIMRHPNRGKGKVVDSLISQIDVFPTICDCLNLPKPDYLQGKSFYQLFENEEIEINDEIFAEVNFHTSYEPIRCVRTKRFKYICYFDENWLNINCSNIDESNQKDFLLANGLQDKLKIKESLYDCYYDQMEVNNVANQQQYQNVLREMQSRLSDFMIRTKDPLVNGELEVKPQYKVNKKTCLRASSKDVQDYDPRGRM